MPNPRLLIFVVTYNAIKTLSSVLERIPHRALQEAGVEAEVLVIDDESIDNTFESGLAFAAQNNTLPITVLSNPANLGYGGNQKLGYHYAIKNEFDFVALVHGDGQYAPEELPRLIAPLLAGEAQAVFGSRMLEPLGALRGNMPIYKFVGNKILTWLQNAILGSTLSEFHSGYRIYSIKALSSVPFDRNSDGFDFDTDIIIQLLAAQQTIRELPIPTFYGDETCHVNGWHYAGNILKSTLSWKSQKLGIFYNAKFDLEQGNTQYLPKFNFPSSHSLALASVRQSDSLLLLGCGPLETTEPFLNKAESSLAVDIEPSEESLCYVQADIDDLDIDSLPKAGGTFTRILALDIIEHLKDPETFLDRIRRSSLCKNSTLVITTPNIAFLPIRLMLLLGAFNYGKRGILDKTHTRLFTFASLKRTLTQRGYTIVAIKGVPAPFPLAFGDNPLSRTLLKLNFFAIKLFRGVFSYQIYIETRAKPTVEQLLTSTFEHSSEKAAKIA